MRAYAFAIVAYYVGRERWDYQTDQAIDLLGEFFVREPDPELTLQYLLSLSVILDYCYEEDYREERRPIGDQIHDYLKQRKKLAARGGPQVSKGQEDDYHEIRSEMLAGPPADMPDGDP